MYFQPDTRNTNIAYYFTRYSESNTQGRQEFIPNFSFTWTVQYGSDIEWLYLHNLKTICCPLPSNLPTKIQPTITSFFSSKFFLQPAPSNNVVLIEWVLENEPHYLLDIDLSAGWCFLYFELLLPAVILEKNSIYNMINSYEE